MVTNNTFLKKRFLKTINPLVPWKTVSVKKKKTQKKTQSSSAPNRISFHWLKIKIHGAPSKLMSDYGRQWNGILTIHWKMIKNCYDDPT